MLKETKIKEEEVKYELCRRHGDCHWVEVSKREKNIERSMGKENRWKRRSRMIDQQGRGIEDISANGKIHQLDALDHHMRRKDRLASEAQKKQVKLT